MSNDALIVYENLVKMISYRGATLEGQILAGGELADKLNQHEYVSISGKRGAVDGRGAATVTIILVAPGSTYSTKSPAFKKLLKLIPPLPTRHEMIFVTSEDITTHIQRQMVNYVAETPLVQLEYYNYEIFKIETPKHTMVPRHEIATEEAVAEFCTKYKTQRGKFPHIIQGEDPMAVWLGLKPGMCVCIDQLSENSGINKVFKICVRGPSVIN